MQNHINLLANDRDALWGLTVTTVAYEEVAPGTPYPARSHADGYHFNPSKGRTLNEYQLLYITEGEGTFQSASMPATKLQEGDFCLLFPGEWHTFSPAPLRGWKGYSIGFTGSNMNHRVQAGFLTPAKPIHHVGFSAGIVSLYNKALSVATQQAAHAQQVMTGIVELLIGLMFSMERNMELSRNCKNHMDMVARASLLIRNNLETSLTIQEVAQQLGVSYSNFRKLFKEHTGFSPATYQQHLRLQRAKELLTTTDMSIKEIAYRLNFDSPDYFTSKFKAVTGRRPSDLRAAQ